MVGLSFLLALIAIGFIIGRFDEVDGFGGTSPDRRVCDFPVVGFGETVGCAEKSPSFELDLARLFEEGVLPVPKLDFKSVSDLMLVIACGFSMLSLIVFESLMTISSTVIVGFGFPFVNAAELANR